MSISRWISYIILWLCVIFNLGNAIQNACGIIGGDCRPARLWGLFGAWFAFIVVIIAIILKRREEKHMDELIELIEKELAKRR